MLGRPLDAVLGGPLPFLAKLIDTASQLSIQVHPADDPDRGVRGKEEAWVILDAAPDASVLAGVAAGVDAAGLDAAMRRAIASPAQAAPLLAMIETIPVRRGMILVIPAGTVHAVGGGILLAEIQQPVDCTYRLFDYGSARAIHPDAAAAAWRLHARPVVWQPDAPPRALHGQHLTMTPLPPGDGHLPAPATPQLLTAVGGGVRVRVTEACGTCDMTLTHGDLALHLRGPARVDVSATALLVVGRVDAPGTTTSKSS